MSIGLSPYRWPQHIEHYLPQHLPVRFVTALDCGRAWAGVGVEVKLRFEGDMDMQAFVSRPYDGHQPIVSILPQPVMQERQRRCFEGRLRQTPPQLLNEKGFGFHVELERENLLCPKTKATLGFRPLSARIGLGHSQAI